MKKLFVFIFWFCVLFVTIICSCLYAFQKTFVLIGLRYYTDKADVKNVSIGHRTIFVEDLFIKKDDYELTIKKGNIDWNLWELFKLNGLVINEIKIDSSNVSYNPSLKDEKGSFFSIFSSKKDVSVDNNEKEELVSSEKLASKDKDVSNEKSVKEDSEKTNEIKLPVPLTIRSISCKTDVSVSKFPSLSLNCSGGNLSNKTEGVINVSVGFKKQNDQDSKVLADLKVIIKQDKNNVLTVQLPKIPTKLILQLIPKVLMQNADEQINPKSVLQNVLPAGLNKIIDLF